MRQVAAGIMSQNCSQAETETSLSAAELAERGHTQAHHFNLGSGTG
ncbi:hypothetical protein LJY18_09030 [Pseudomonas sp. MMS21-TM103]|nr:hypothetical protein [Pseudomonas sp. MMS21 TM103]MCG4453447.1 hypothetical protein [Pseudomonas sp. MMS21 TM103]